MPGVQVAETIPFVAVRCRGLVVEIAGPLKCDGRPGTPRTAHAVTKIGKGYKTGFRRCLSLARSAALMLRSASPSCPRIYFHSRNRSACQLCCCTLCYDGCLWHLRLVRICRRPSAA